MSLSVGDAAPDFSLPDQDKQVVSLAGLRGSPVLLVFYPFAFSGLCTGELCQLRDELADYTDAGVQVLAISTDPVFSLKAFRDKEGFDFPLLSDFWPHGEVAQAYGALDAERGCAERATFIIDRDGVLRWQVQNAMPDARSIDAYVRVLSSLG